MLRLILIDILEGTKISLKSLTENKIRSVLTTLGIIIGIVAVTTMSTAIVGLENSFTESISRLGNDVLFIDKFEWFNTTDFREARNRKDIDLDQFEKLKKSFSQKAYFSPLKRTFGRTVKYKSKSVTAGMILGTSNYYEKTSSSIPEKGRYFTEMEYEANRNVCVIGKDIASGLFDKDDPLNKHIKLNNTKVEVIGVLEKQGGGLFGGNTLDGQIILPLRVYEKITGDKKGYMRIDVKLNDIRQVEDAKAEIRYLMRLIRKVPLDQPDDFAINQQEMFRRMYDQTIGVVATAGIVITALSLFVGAIGIMNIMFVSVTERTREIGIRKAIGAKRWTILIQFLIEAAILCLLGGSIGILISFPLSLVINQFLPTAMPLNIVLLSLSVSALVGIVSGMLPAIKASKMDPVEALRYE
ncbi:MAG: ABC transporter permease [Bacteroidetes bacterium]|nr:ABC transporter permease [Bacteroidota bacterium]